MLGLLKGLKAAEGSMLAKIRTLTERHAETDKVAHKLSVKVDNREINIK